MNPDFQNMWAGGVTGQGQGDSFPSQWSMGSGTQYNNVPHEQVDWASLAQQWIRMKEETPAEKEGGEAPMEMDKDDTSAPPERWNHPEGWNSWGWEQNWGWNSTKPPSSFPNFPPPSSEQVPHTNQFFPSPIPPESFSNSPAGSVKSYWSDHKDSWENNHSKKKGTPLLEPPPELDAAKRKQLPAWIREGLEKMEREKQKKAENEKQEKIRREELAKKAELSKNLDGTNGEPQIPQKSKFDSESEESEPEVHEQTASRLAKPQISPPKRIFKTKEQILEACMTDVRKILTQILMEVTSEEIRKAVNDTVKKLKKKEAPAATLRKTPALSSLTGKLGLGIYGSDESSSDSEQENAADLESDQEIRDRITRLKNEFVKVEVRIEKEIAEQEERERRQLGEGNNDENKSKNVEEQVQPISKGSKEKKEKEVKKKDRRSRSSSRSSTSTSHSSPYYKKSRHRKRTRSSSRSRSRSSSRDRRHKKRSRHSRYRGRRRSSSSSSSEHRNRKSGRRR